MEMDKLSFPYLPISYCVITLAACVYAITDSGWSNKRVVGLIIIIISYAFWVTARLQLGKAFSLRPKSKFLVTTGFYSKLRHPVYVFSVTMLTGLTIFFWNLPLLVFTFAILILEIWRRSKEEDLLLKKFGKQYADYQKSSWF
jgi:protein-S-isoprenylcysteine O-methyltransferase Ste14